MMTTHHPMSLHNDNTLTIHNEDTATVYYHNTDTVTTHNDSNSPSHVIFSVPGQVSQHNTSPLSSLIPCSSCHVADTNDEQQMSFIIITTNNFYVLWFFVPCTYHSTFCIKDWFKPVVGPVLTDLQWDWSKPVDEPQLDWFELVPCGSVRFLGHNGAVATDCSCGCGPSRSKNWTELDS